jgi:hypothetical protein
MVQDGRMSRGQWVQLWVALAQVGVAAAVVAAALFVGVRAGKRSQHR